MKQGTRWIRKTLILALAAILAGMALYSYLAFSPTGYGELLAKRQEIERNANLILKPVETSSSVADTLIATDTLPCAAAGGGDCLDRLMALDKEAAADWIDGLGGLGQVELALPANLFDQCPTSGPLTLPLAMMRRITATLPPLVAGIMNRRTIMKKWWPANDATTASLHRALDRMEGFLLDAKRSYPTFTAFPQNENQFGFHALSVLEIERASLRGEREKATRLMLSYLEHERIYHVGQFPPYPMYSIPVYRATAALMILGGSGALTDDALRQAQTALAGFELSPAQMVSLRRAHGLRLGEQWSRDLGGMRATGEKTAWRKVSRQYPSALVAFFALPVIRNQLKAYAATMGSGDVATTRHARWLFSAAVDPIFRMDNAGLLTCPVWWNDFYSGKLISTDEEINANVVRGQWLLALVRCHKATGRYPEQFEELLPWLASPLPAGASAGWSIGRMPAQDALAYIGCYSREHQEPDAIDRAIVRYHDEHQVWPAAPESLTPYLGSTAGMAEVKTRQAHLNETPLLCYANRTTWNMPAWEASYDDQFACLTPAERTALRRRVELGERKIDMVEVRINYLLFPLIADQLKAMLR